MRLMPGPEHGAQAAEAFDHVLLGLRHDPHAKPDADDEEQRDEKERRAPAAQPACKVIDHATPREMNFARSMGAIPA